MGNPRLKFLTYNAGLFRLKLFGRHLYAPAPFVEERFAELAPAILSCDADIVALQEVYDAEHQMALSESLGMAYPFQSSWTERRYGRLGSGLMLFSRYPILDSHGHHFEDMPFDERLFVEKGIMIALIDAGAFGHLAVANCHHTSGGAVWDPEGSFTDQTRRRQYRQLFETLKNARTEKRVALGDFNSGPEATGGSYRELVSNGYADAWALCHGEKSVPTWNPENPLNAGGPHRKYAAQRLDHVLANGSFLDSALPVSARIVFSDPAVSVPGKGKVSISDHCGVAVDFELSDLKTNG